MDNIWLSVIIPIYNPPRENFEEAMHCLLSNMHEGVEILLIDDGSDDWVGEYVVENIDKDSEIRYLRKKNGGVSSARNLGIEKARGEYLCFADADDKFYLDRLLKQKPKISNNIELVLFDIMREEIKSKNRMRISLFEKDVIGVIDNLHEILAESCKLCESVAKLYRRDILLKNNIWFDVTMTQGEDAVFVCQYITQCKHFHYIHEIVYDYIWNDQMMKKRCIEKPEERLDDLRKSYEASCLLLQGKPNLLEKRTFRYIEALGSRTLMLIQSQTCSREIRQKIMELYMLCKKQKIAGKGKKAKVYQFLFRHNCWIGFRVLAKIRYHGEKNEV